MPCERMAGRVVWVVCAAIRKFTACDPDGCVLFPHTRGMGIPPGYLMQPLDGAVTSCLSILYLHAAAGGIRLRAIVYTSGGL